MDSFNSRLNGITTSAANYYRPLFRSGSVTPLWHMMIATSIVMYTATYIGVKGGKKQEERKVQKLALAEYYEKHGHSGHH